MAFSSIAKITKPQVPDVIMRERLFRLIDSNGQRPITWITAPPGAGKTILAASYLDARNLPCLWYQVDEGDGDVATFFYYLGLAAKKAMPRQRNPLPLLSPEYLHGIPVFTRRYFEELFRRVLTRHRSGWHPRTPDNSSSRRPFRGSDQQGGSSCGKFMLVFDNYQEAPLDSGFHEMLVHGLDTLPAGIDVMVISRAESPPAFARLLANSRMKALGWDQIRFTLEESEELARTLGWAEPNDAAMPQLHAMTDGWAAGLTLLLGGSEHQADSFRAEKEIRQSESIITGGEELFHAVFAYFVAEIFARMDDKIQDFLLKTAILPEITFEIAEKLTGNRHSQRILSDLAKKNYFTFALSNNYHSASVFQYHPLFREFLLSQARRLFNGNKSKNLHRKAASILEKAGRLQEAVELLFDAGDERKAAILVLGQAKDTLAGGRGWQLEKWLQRLPATLFEEMPWLYYWRGACYLPIAPARARGCFAMAFQGFVAEDDEIGTLLAWSGAVNAILLERGNARQLNSWVAWMDSRMENKSVFPDRDIELPVVSSMVGAILLRDIHHSRAGLWIEWAEELVANPAEDRCRITLAVNLVMYHLVNGDLARGTILLKGLAPLITPAAPPFARIAWCMINAMHAQWVEGDGEGAIGWVDRGLDLAGETGIHVFDLFLFCQGVHGGLTMNDMQTAGKFLQTMALLLKDASQWYGSYFHFLSGWRDLCESNAFGAREHFLIALGFARKVDSTFAMAVSHVGMAQAFLDLDDTKRAGMHIARARSIRPGDHDHFEFLYLLSEARLSLRKDDEAMEIELIGRAMTLGRKRGYVNTQFWRQPVMSLICAKALTAGIEVDYVREIIRRRRLPPPVSNGYRSGLECWPYPVKIYTLGRFEILVDDIPLQFAGKVQKKPLEMLKALIALGGRNVEEERLADLLWPEADGDSAHSAFTTTLSRLRRLLGSEGAIRIQAGNIFLNPNFCWVDAQEFERVLDQPESEGPSASEQRQSRANAALALYRGSFLSADAGCSWSISPRERLKGKFIRHVIQTSASLEEQGEWRHAADCYLKALELEDLCEELYQRLMLCYSRIGRHAEAMRIYARCRETLSACLGVAPSPETVALHRKLQADSPPIFN
jgi:LuxR family transcriptional regulator, maltose regulon positive regulatory protein